MNQLHRFHARGSQDRLDRFIRERLAPGADKARIDQRIWDLFGEDWCVMFTDLSGFSRRVEEFGIIHFLQIIHEAGRLLIPVIEDHEGILLKLEGDSFLVIFRNPQKALKCAVDLQHLLAAYDLDRLPEEQVLLCVGMGYGRVLRIGDSDVFGSEVNAASKLGEDRDRAGEFLVTGAFRAQCGDVAGTGYAEIEPASAGTATAFRVAF
jgi:class 3 adenylate cyclase